MFNIILNYKENRTRFTYIPYARTRHELKKNNSVNPFINVNDSHTMIQH